MENSLESNQLENTPKENDVINDEKMNFLFVNRVLPCFPSVTERYYQSEIIKHKKNQDLLILAHSNRVSIVTLAPMHEILTEKKQVTSIDFNVTRANRLDNQVKGKGKKGAQQVKHESILCAINCSDGVIYRIPACINGKIIEINKRLVDEPSLITEKPWSDGFIAIILPPFSTKNDL